MGQAFPRLLSGGHGPQYGRSEYRGPTLQPVPHTATSRLRVFTKTDELDGGWIAWCEDFPGCVSQGETEEEALEHLGEALGLAISERALDGPSV